MSVRLSPMTLLWPIEDRVYLTISANGDVRWERHINLRVVPTVCLAFLIWELQFPLGHQLLAGLAAAVGLTAAKSIWPISGGPGLPLCHWRVPAPDKDLEI